MEWPCRYCHKFLSSNKSRWKHENKHCPNRPKIGVVFKLKNAATAVENQSPPQKITFETVQKNPPTKPVTPTPPKEVPFTTDIAEKILREINALREQISATNKQPPIVNNYTVNIIGKDFYHALIQKMGEQGAMRFLAKSAGDNQPGEVFKKLYLEGNDPSNYPVATNSNIFRFLDEDSNCVVNDPGGHIFIDMVSSRVQTAMIHATNDLIEYSINHNTVDELYDIYDIGKIQRNIAQMHRNKEYLLQELNSALTNPEHPFFAP